ALERRERRGVVLELARGLPQVVQDAVVREELISALELHERRGEVLVLVKGDAALEVLARLVGLVGRGRRFLIAGANLARRRKHGEREGEQHGSGRRSHCLYGSFSSIPSDDFPAFGRAAPLPAGPRTGPGAVAVAATLAEAT